jgi:hypothetical protein
MDDSVFTAVDLSNVGTAKIIQDDDTISADTPTVKTADTVSWTVSSDNLFHCILLARNGGGRGGDEYHGAPILSGAVSGAIIQTTDGYYMFYASPTGSGTLVYKPIGGAVQKVAPYDWYGRTSFGYYTAGKARWTVRLISLTEFSILLEGMEICRSKIASGYIINAGFTCYNQTGSSVTMGWQYVSKTTRKRALPGTAQNIIVIGDSISSDIADGWPYWMREALDGQGIYLENILNIAHPGDTSSNQVTALASASLSGITHGIVLIGTNDIQMAGSIGTLVSNVESMIDTLSSAGISSTVVIPPLWYSAAIGLSGGQPTANYDGGGLYRAAIMRIAASKGSKVVDLASTIGALTTSYKANYLSYPEPRLRDNIHPTSWLYKTMGHEIARHVGGKLCPVMTQKQPETLLSASSLVNGWTMATQQPTFRISEDGFVTISGIFDAGTKTDGTSIYQLPPNLRPKSIHRVAVRGGGGSLVELDINPDGTVVVFGVQSGDPYIVVDGAMFEAK